MAGLIKKFKLKSNPVSIRRVVIAEALAATVCAHAVLFALFYYRPAVAPRAASKVAQITLFSADSVSPERRAMAENWLANHDPAAIGRSDRTGSPLERIKTVTRSEPPSREFPEVEIKPGEHRPIEPGLLPVEESKVSPLPGRTPAEAVFPRFAPVEYPEMLFDGKKAAMTLPAELRRMGKSLNAAETEVQIGFDPVLESGRFRVVRSSGSVRLDLQLARELMRQYPERNGTFVIRWSEGGGKL